MIKLKEKPFYLKDEQIKEIENLLEHMTTDEKIGQLFIPICYSKDPDFLQREVLDYHVGGVMYRPGKGREQHQVHSWLQTHSKIPLLIGANLEAGGTGTAVDGTFYGSQMQVAATGKTENAYRLGKIAASEGKAVGCNWAFAPVVDIDRNWRNPITNTRTYGNDPEFILSCALEYKRAADEEHMAVAVKHFPGDGCDEVDQHILTSVNTCSCEEWDSTYGKIYKGMIKDGALTFMVGHIALPSYQEQLTPDSPKQLIPASLSPELLQKLLREQLGFNGLITTDSSCMVGFASAMERRKAIPYCIEAGCDMILFNKVLKEDIAYMKQGVAEGILSESRLNEAVLRILATKAALGLFSTENYKIVPAQDPMEVLESEEHRRWALECADESVTLVKDTQSLLPLNAEKEKRVLLEVLGNFPSNERVTARMKEKLENEGFEVEVYEPEKPGPHDFSVETFRSKYDLVFYVGNVENASNHVTNRLNWHTFFGNGNNCPWFVKEKPVLFVSLGNPYHLVDIPMIQTYVNCYANDDVVIDAMIEKVMGRSPFKGKSPTDPFVGKEYLKY